MPYNRLSGVLRAAGEPIISEYSIFYGTLLPSAYTPKRWVDREAREDQRTATTRITLPTTAVWSMLGRSAKPEIGV